MSKRKFSSKEQGSHSGHPEQHEVTVLGSGLHSIVYGSKTFTLCEEETKEFGIPKAKKQTARFPHPFFSENEVIKITRQRCALQALAIKQHVKEYFTTKEKEAGSSISKAPFIFPNDDILCLRDLDQESQRRIQSHLKESKNGLYSKSCGLLKCNLDEMVALGMMNGGQTWSTWKVGKTEKELHEAKTQLLTAVLSLHHCGITHNDLQDRNVLISFIGKSFTLKIIDWEFAVVHDEESKDERLFNNLGPFSILRFFEVLNHSHHKHHEQIEFDWMRVWSIIQDYRGINWKDVSYSLRYRKLKQKSAFSEYVKELISSY
jgi:serine/threonine protein kinase